MIARGLVAAGLLATLVACGSSEDSAGTPKTSTTAASPVASPMISPTPLPPGPVPPIPPIPPANDGQNYKACNDGVCEMLIRKKAVLNLNGDKFTATVAAAPGAWPVALPRSTGAIRAAHGTQPP